jgi:2-haloacid dehalogenase
MAAYLELDCYPEVPAVLDQLKARGMRTAILSNGSPKMLQAAVASSDLENRIGAVLSVEAVKVYKPDPRVYQLAVDSLQLPAEAIAFLSANAWDAAGAAAFGLRVAWVNRFAQQPEHLPGDPDAHIASLAALPDLLAA